MKLWSNEHTYSYPWNQVSIALWQKYPNAETPHVLTVDVINRELDQDRKILRTERLLTLRQPFPNFLTRLFSSSSPLLYVHEISEVNLIHQTFSAISTNLTFRELVYMKETVEYKPDPKDPTRTVFKQSASVHVSLARFSNHVEELAIHRIKMNAGLGRRALEQVIDKLLLEGQLGLQHLQHLKVR
ncbi:hypothetical protein HMI54_007799 [Coelomomyces lativittatus]|nr:hypothetical protein HMI56_004887 [Coelomomyces lativittatus]KAJ1503770.1 hypothetical protein HMI54_007799 [Coelomomyces lativittatus]KAJ1506242.1 hypothetical protein HMI55_001258 [Coelomomyces lativittatus]